MNEFKLLCFKFWQYACLIKPEAYTLLNFIFWRWQRSAKYLQLISSLQTKPYTCIFQCSPSQLCLSPSPGCVIKGSVLHWHSKGHSPRPGATWQRIRVCFLPFPSLRSSLWEGSWESREATFYFPVVLQKMCTLSFLEGSLLTRLLSNHRRRLKGSGSVQTIPIPVAPRPLRETQSLSLESSWCSLIKSKCQALGRWG